MDVIEIIGAVVAATLVLVAAARLIGRPKTVAPAPREVHEVQGTVGAFVGVVNRCASEEDPEYRAAVAALRDDSNAADAIVEAYERASPDLRPSLLLAAGVAGPQMRSFLVRVATTPVQGGGIDAAVEASRLRLMAIDGLERLAAGGEQAGWEDIEKLAGSPDRAVQIGAVAALKFNGQSEALERLRKRLPADRRHVFDVERPNVRDVPQVADPRRHLRGRERTVDDRPHPDVSAGGEAGERRRPKRGAPDVGESRNG